MMFDRRQVFRTFGGWECEDRVVDLKWSVILMISRKLSSPN